MPPILYIESNCSTFFIRNQLTSERTILILTFITVPLNQIASFEKTDFSKLIDKEKDLFLIFNYTKILEKLYNSKNVCPIHGVQVGKIYFGHGDKTDHTEYYERNHIGSCDTLRDLDEQLRTKTEDALSDNQSFFNFIDQEISEIS